MNLFIDTHDSLITIGLKIGNNIFIKTKESESTHSVYVMPMIDEIFKENNVDVKNLDSIVVVNGPGSFTGIRIGLSIAKTIAYSLKIKINTISSLKAYLISNNNSCDRFVSIEDNKGYYMCAFDKNNNVILDECYSNKKITNYPEIEKILDINKIFDYFSNVESENPHFIKANYIKKIEVEK